MRGEASRLLGSLPVPSVRIVSIARHLRRAGGALARAETTLSTSLSHRHARNAQAGQPCETNSKRTDEPSRPIVDPRPDARRDRDPGAGGAARVARRIPAGVARPPA